jgi:hypothetical protein
MRYKSILANTALILMPGMGPAFAAEDSPRVPSRSTEGPDIRATLNHQHRPCPETGDVCPSGGASIEGPETR